MQNDESLSAAPGVAQVIRPRTRDLGGFTVGRVLPFAKRRMVGPFIFFDEMGPADFAPGTGIDVRPHPHIGLATVTYLFDGELRHRDSLGCDQVIRPGDVNWMTAGRGIVHSERTDAAPRAEGQRMHGIQTWIALPEDAEETAPSFHHHPRETLPLIETDGAAMRLIAGSAFGETSPIETFSPMFYLAADADAGAALPVPDGEDRAIYVVDGELSVNGAKAGTGAMVVFERGASTKVRATTKSRAMLLGGAPLGGRIIWWNLVSSSQARIDAAKRDWAGAAEAGFPAGGRFPLPPGESEHIPLPAN